MPWVVWLYTQITYIKVLTHFTRLGHTVRLSSGNILVLSVSWCIDRFYNPIPFIDVLDLTV
jgi:hypothetical protein